MALQINKPLTTLSNFAVPSGSYVWITMELGADRLSRVRAKLEFFKDKASFDLGRSRYQPLEIPTDKQIYSMDLPISSLSTLTYAQAHTFIQTELNQVLGGSFVDIVA